MTDPQPLPAPAARVKPVRKPPKGVVAASPVEALAGTPLPVEESKARKSVRTSVVAPEAGLADGDPIRAPDGTWCLYQARLRMPRAWGADEATIRSELSARVGSLWGAYDLMLGAEARWPALLEAVEDPLTRAALIRRLGPDARPLPPLREPPRPAESVYGYNAGLPVREAEAAPSQGGEAARPKVVTMVQQIKNRKKQRAANNAERLQTMIRMFHEEKLSLEDISQKLELKVSTIRTYLYNASVEGKAPPFRKPGSSRRSPEEMQALQQELAGLVRQGQTVAQAAETLGLTYGTAWRLWDRVKEARK